MIPRQIIVNLVESDTAPPLSFRFSGLTLSDYTSITMRAVKPNGERFTRTLTPDGTDVELGTVTLQSTDLVRGRTTVEFRFVTATGEFKLPQKNPIYFDVRKEYG